MNVFFVCGAPKSGTTWLQRILDAHPEVCCSGEGHFIERFSAPVADVVRNYNRRMNLEAAQVYEGRPYYEAVDQAEFDELMRGFILGRLRARASDRTRWVGDKTPRYTRHLVQLNRLFPDAKILHIVRDPRDVAVSRMGHSQRVGYSEIFARESDEHKKLVENLRQSWAETVSAVDDFARTHPGLVHEVRYRDLFEQPVEECVRLFGFLGAPTDRILMERIAAETSFEALSGRRPGEEDPASFLRKGMPGDWKTRLDPVSARLITERCGELMREKRFTA